MSGTSYANWNSGVGLNIVRPVISAFYLAIYLVPLGFPAAFLLNRKQFLISFVVACIGAVILCLTGEGFLQWGPIRSLAVFAGRFPLGAQICLALLGFLAIFNACSLVIAFGIRQRGVTQSSYFGFSILVLLFFVFEQLGVGGNIQFYERYVLQVAPFLGIVAFGIVPEYRGSRLAVLAAMLVFSNLMLWRYT